jgi:hypothetical protein
MITFMDIVLDSPYEENASLERKGGQKEREKEEGGGEEEEESQARGASLDKSDA